MQLFVQEKVGVPDKTERFNWGDYEEDNSLLKQLRNLGPDYISYLKKRCLHLSVMSIGLGVILFLVGFENALLTMPFVLLALVGCVWLGGVIGYPIYKEKLALVEDRFLWSAAFSENLETWAMSRYAFKSVEEFEDTFGNKGESKCYLERKGSKSGLIVSSDTFEELPLKA